MQRVILQGYTATGSLAKGVRMGEIKVSIFQYYDIIWESHWVHIAFVT